MSGFRFGLQIGNFELARLRDIGQAAEGLGFHALYVPDHIVHEGPETDSPAATRGMAEGYGRMIGLEPEAVLCSPLALIGTPEECVAELRRRARAWEVTEFVFPYAGEETTRRLAEEVLARL